MSAEDNTELQNFIRFMVLAPRLQAISILTNITRKQCDFIRQIAYNILFNQSIDFSEQDRDYFKRKSISIKQLASKRICLTKKRDILVYQYPVVRRLIDIVAKYLLE